MADDFDVFLSHNSRDKPVVGEIAERLRGRGLRVWLDQSELRPGFPWQEGLENGVQVSRSVAVFVGADGLGAWQQPEMRAFLARSRREQIPVIPVLLPDSPDSHALTVFLEAFTWVDLRQGLTEAGLARLIWGITGEKPGPAESRAWPGERPGPKDQGTGTFGALTQALARSRARKAWSWGIGLSLAGVALALAAWLWPRSPTVLPPPKPETYAVRVAVLDPQGHSLDDATVRTSVSNESKRLPNGWWEVDIPAAKVPANGWVSFWADHKDWEGNQAGLHLGKDPNPPLEIRLKPPEAVLRGRVVDGRQRSVSGALVFPADGTPSKPGRALTNAEGQFELKLPVPRETSVRLRAERTGLSSDETLCYAGRDGCSITLGDQ